MTQLSLNKSTKKQIKNNQNEDQQKRTVTQRKEIEIDEKEQQQNFRYRLLSESLQTDVEVQEDATQDIWTTTESGGQEKITMRKVKQNNIKYTKNIFFEIKESHSQSQLSDNSSEYCHTPTSRQDKNKSNTPQQHSSHPRQKTINKHIHQIQQRINKSHYPQNVMYRVFPVQNKINNNVSKKYIREENILNHQRVPLVKQSSWNIDIGRSLSKEQKHQQLGIPTFGQLKQRFQYVQWTEKQSSVICLNVKWIADVLFLTLNENENANLSQPQVHQVRKQTLSKQVLERSSLQLKCIFRYRSIVEIVQQLQKLNLAYQQHGESILLSPLIKSSLVQVNYSVAKFQNLVIQQFTKLLLSQTIEYKHASKQNKQFLCELFKNNQARMQDAKQLSDFMDQKEVTKMLQKERIFQPYKKKVRVNKWRRGIQARDQTEERQRIDFIKCNRNSDVEI